MTRISFYGGIGEVGGNKFLVEDGSTRVMLDFGMQMGLHNEYYAEFMQPRGLNGMGDLIELGLLPKVRGIYRRDLARHMDYAHFEDDSASETACDAVLLTHAHVDHFEYIHYLREDIPIHCTRASEAIMRTFEDTSAERKDFVSFAENYRTLKKVAPSGKYKGQEVMMFEKVSRDDKEPRPVSHVEDKKKFRIGTIEVEPVAIDHSIPGEVAYILHTSDAAIAYTGDIRFHGRRPEQSESFVDRCAESDIDYMLCEGTRIKPDDKPSTSMAKTEEEIERGVSGVLSDEARDLVIAGYPARDLDRLLSFYNAAKSAGRTLTIDLKQAYLLDQMHAVPEYEGVYPRAGDPNIAVFASRKSKGLIAKDRSEWDQKIREEDYKIWERGYLDASVNYKDVADSPGKYVFYCNDFHLTDLIDIQPGADTRYIRSMTEPFNDEMAIDHLKVKRWLKHFGILAKDAEWERYHVSGHGDAEQISRVIERSKPKAVIPIHTTDEDSFESLHGNVRRVGLGSSLDLPA